MLDFILQISIIVSLCAVIYLFARALPRVGGEDIARAPKKRRFEEFFKKLPLKKIDEAMSAFLEKILRKFRVVLLKFENFIDSIINRLRKGSNFQNGDKPNSQDLFNDKK